MKKIFFIGLALFMASSAFAQNNAAGAAKVGNETEKFEYTRNGLTVLYNLSNQKGWTIQTPKELFGDKFDYNEIESSYAFGTTAAEVQKNLESHSVPKEVLQYLLCAEKGNGLSMQRLEDRYVYNRSDQDVLVESAAKVDQVKLAAPGMIKNTYIMVVGPDSIKKSTDKKGNISYSVEATAYVFKAVRLDSILNDVVFETCWADSSFKKSDRDSLLNIFYGIEPKIELVAIATAKGSESDKIKAINEAVKNVLDPLEKKIADWQVVTTIYSKNPIAAKVGKKEGLKNSDRYRAFKVVEDENGNITYKKMGFLRVTKVAKNDTIADGSTHFCSNFYQISGRRLKEGQYLRQAKDKKLGVSLSGYTSIFSYGEVTFDYLIHTSQTLGIMQYGMVSIGFDMKSWKDMGDIGNVMYVPVQIGYGIGIHPIRWIEIQPFVMVGADVIVNKFDENDDEEKLSKKIGYIATAGLKVGFNLTQSLQLFGQCSYGYQFDGGEQYKAIKEVLDVYGTSSNKTHDKGFRIGGGIKYTF